MARLLEIKEFQSITYNQDYLNDSNMAYLDERTFAELENFILEYTDTSDTQAMDFLKISTRRNVGKIIQARNYVGLIQTKSGTQIQILPKITQASDYDTKKIFIKMLRSMKDFPIKVYNNAALKMDQMNLYEIFINMYIQEVNTLVKRGIRSSYLKTEANLNFYKGKLNVSEQIRVNAAHRERFYMSYDEFSINRPENRLIKSTLIKLQEISTNTSNIKLIRQLLLSFEMVNPSSNYIKDFNNVVIDRNTKEYDVILQWSRVFLMNLSFTSFAGNTSARALLFPMEKVFESYVARNLKKVTEGLDWRVSIQDKGYYLFDSPCKFALRPDIVITREDGSRIILDTKWKSLINNPDKNYGISQGDMYQMYAYAKKYQTKEIWLLYPENDESKEMSEICFSSDDQVQVRVYFVDVKAIEESLEGLVRMLES